MNYRFYFFCLFILFVSNLKLNAQVYLDDIDNKEDTTFVVDTIWHSSIINTDDANSDQTEFDTNLIKFTPKQAFQDLSWEDFLKVVDSTGKKYFVQFTASWCGPCKMMDKEVFKKDAVIEMANSTYLAKLIDIDDFDGIQITQDMRIKSIPATIIFDCHGKELKRLEGFQFEDMFLNTLKRYQ